MSSPIRAVVFDMDGVIFDTEPLYFAAEDEMLRRRGLRFTPALAEKIMGMPGLVAMDWLRRELGLPDSADELFREAQAGFRRRLELELRFISGFEDFFAAACDRALPRAVATSTHGELARQMLERFDLPRRFHAILTRDDVRLGKPHPEVFLKACAALRSEPWETLVLEDSLHGVTAALAAGCRTVAVRHGHNRHLRFPAGTPEVETLADPWLHTLLPASTAAANLGKD
jgi:beta-phosphoglucomutase-like phosphatase (HAD superfamily)